MKKYLLLSIIMFANYTYCQKLTVKSFKKKNNKLEINLTILNTSKSEYTFYKPMLKDFCNGIVITTFKTNSEIADFPCEKLIQLDHITLDEKNSILLKENEAVTISYEIKFFQNLNNINEIRCQINYRDYEFTYNENEKKFHLFKNILSTDYTKIE